MNQILLSLPLLMFGNMQSKPLPMLGRLLLSGRGRSTTTIQIVGVRFLSSQTLWGIRKIGMAVSVRSGACLRLTVWAGQNQTYWERHSASTLITLTTAIDGQMDQTRWRERARPSSAGLVARPRIDRAAFPGSACNHQPPNRKTFGTMSGVFRFLGYTHQVGQVVRHERNR